MPSLKLDDPASLAGSTYYSDPKTVGEWIRPTFVYLPPNATLEKGTINLIVWLHGWYVGSVTRLFRSDPAKMREQVLASSKPVVLAAPYLGNGTGDDKTSTYAVGGLKGNFGERFIEQVTDALSALGTSVKIDKLALASHSGGGEAMRYMADSLGRFSGNLQECWGFDCLYGAHAKPDDANFWFDWVGANSKSVFVRYALSTVPQSVKLQLMGRGLADGQGDRREPQAAASSAIDVKLSIGSAKSEDDLMELSSLSSMTKPTRPPHPGERFVEKAASNLRKNAGWPGDKMAMHYAAATDGLLERLKGAKFL